jgi:hypothetical protein
MLSLTLERTRDGYSNPTLHQIDLVTSSVMRGLLLLEPDRISSRREQRRQGNQSTGHELPGTPRPLLGSTVSLSCTAASGTVTGYQAEAGSSSGASNLYSEAPDHEIIRLDARGGRHCPRERITRGARGNNASFHLLRHTFSRIPGE